MFRSMRSARLGNLSGRALLRYRSADRKDGAEIDIRIVSPQVPDKLIQPYQSTTSGGVCHSSCLSVARQGPHLFHPCLSALAHAFALVCVTLGRNTLRRRSTNVFLPRASKGSPVAHLSATAFLSCRSQNLHRPPGRPLRNANRSPNDRLRYNSLMSRSFEPSSQIKDVGHCTP